MAIINSSRFDFSDYVSDMLQNYGYQVVEAMTLSINEVADEAAKKLRTQTETPRKTGRYAKGWTVKKERGRLTTSATVHGKSGTYQLAHLLEFGHAHRKGGRAHAFPHIADVEKWAIDEAHERTVHRLEGGI